eukprot:2178311-Pyramimonas_sp.AAC.3
MDPLSSALTRSEESYASRTRSQNTRSVTQRNLIEIAPCAWAPQTPPGGASARGATGRGPPPRRRWTLPAPPPPRTRQPAPEARSSPL